MLIFVGCSSEPIPSAILENDFDTFKREVRNNGGVNKADKAGLTPIQYASEYASKKYIRYLLENGADVNEGLSTALFYYDIFKNHFVQAKPRLESIELLLDKGGNNIDYSLLLMVSNPPSEFTKIVTKYKNRNKAKRLEKIRKEKEDAKAKELAILEEKKQKQKELALANIKEKESRQEQRDILLLETLQALNNNGIYKGTVTSKEILKQEYKDNIKPQYTFTENSKENYDSFALIIGINHYKLNTDVEYADLSALAFEELANKTLGIPQENIITILNDDATSGQLKAKFELIKELSDSNGNIYIYYAGHGVPGKDGSTYLLPSDMSADSIHLEPNLKLDHIYSKLSKLNAKNIFVFMDSCFSGKDDGGFLLYKGVAPVLKSKKTIISGDKLTVFTAGQATDFANDLESKKQRMFSYFLIKELSKGKTDLSAIYPKIKSKVKRASLQKGIGYKQVPQLYGNKGRLLY